MSSIVLSASVRQNLLSLQSTADLLATTQTRLSSGKKVNSALDNPTNYFTASALDGRASDINNLLDGIGNGVQVLQAANTGISSLEKLVSNAKSVANQALQTTVGYSTKSSFTATITGATANNLLGPGGAPTDAAATAGAVINNALNTPAAITGATTLGGGVNTNSLSTDITASDTIVVNGVTISFNASGTTTGTAVGGDLSLDIATSDVADVLAAIDAITGTAVASTISGGAITLHTGTAADLVISGGALDNLGLTAGTTARTAGTPPALQGQTLTIAATGGGTATSIIFGSSGSQVNTLDELNAALVANNLQRDDQQHRRAHHHHVERCGFGHVRYDRWHGGCFRRSLRRRGRFGSGTGCRGSVDPHQPREAVQQHHSADHEHLAGCIFWWRQPAGRRPPLEAGVQRNRQVGTAQHHRRSTSTRRASAWRAWRLAPTSSTTMPPERCWHRSTMPPLRCARRHRPWARTCRSCRSAKTSPGT